MARYNSSSGTATISTTATISSPYSGAFTEFTGTAPYTVTLPSPVLYPGTSQTFYNATAGTVTLSTPSGLFSGLGASGAGTQTVPTNTVVSVTSDGTNYVVLSEDGSALVATTGTFSGNVDMSGASATVTISPQTLTMSPTSSGTINNTNIGTGTRGSGAFNTLAANGAVTFTANTASSSTSTGTLVVTGGIGASGTVYASGINATNLTGTLQTASQTNITAVGTLSALKVAAGSTGIVLANASSGAYEDVKLSYNGYNAGQPIITVQPNTTPGSGILTTYTYFKNSNGTSASSNNLHGIQVDSTLAVGVSGLGVITAYGNPLYAYKDVSNISNGAQESLSAGIFGKAQTTGDISVFVGADQGTTKYGFVGAVNRGTGYVPLVLQPAGGTVGIGVILNPANTMLHIKGDWVGGHSTVKIQTTTSVAGGGTTGLGLYDSDATRRAIIYSNSNAGLNFETSGSTAQNFYIAGVLKLQIDTGGNLLPGADAALNLGSPTLRWNNIYTADAHFSNEGTVGNSVDGTTGNWTLQEGENDIYMLNNKTGKRFKIKLEEV